MSNGTERRRQDPTDSILREMDRMHREGREDIQAVRAGISDLREDVAGLKVKTGFLATIAGSISGGLAAFGLWITQGR